MENRLNRNKISKEQAVFITLAICVLLMTAGLMFILFRPSKSTPENASQHREFSYTEKNVVVGEGDSFDVVFPLNGENPDRGQGWSLLTSFNRSVLSIMGTEYDSVCQRWKFYAKQPGRTHLSFTKGESTVQVMVVVE